MQTLNLIMRKYETQKREMLYFFNEGPTIKNMAQVINWKMPKLDKNIIKTLNLLK